MKMNERSIYTDDFATMKVVEIRRNMITACERNKLFPKDDLMWNRAVTAGNKLTTIGTVYGIKSVKELSKDESNAVQEFLKNKDKYI